MAERYSRRDVLRQTLAAVVAASGASRLAFAAEEPGWDAVPAILKRIQAPQFAARDFDITRYGARADGSMDCTAAIAAAVTACNRAGGGTVVAPAGEYLTGAIHLLSNVNLHLAEGAVLRFFTDPRKYLPLVFTRWEGAECVNYSPFVYAFGRRNVGISGKGVLDGQCDCKHWWPWKGRTECGWSKGDPDQAKARELLFKMAEGGVPPEKRIFGEGHYLRPMFIQTYKCRNVLVEGVTIRNSPMWEIHPVLCENVTVRNVTIVSHGPNNDGCDPESCKDVLIEGCHFDTGDDCIAIKSGRNADGRRLAVPSEDLIVRGCRMKDGHGGVTIGSEISGNVRNVFAENCRMDSPNLDRVLRLKTNAARGGVLENIFMRNIEVGQVADSLLSVDFFYEEGPNGSFKPLVRRIEMDSVTCRKAKYALYLRGFKDGPIRDIRIRNCTVESAALANVVENVEGLHLENVKINGKPVSA